MWDAEKSLRSAFTVKMCLHPDASSTTCSGQIIRAHTVRRAADLKAIERIGHVYSVHVDMKTLNRTKGKPSIRLIGINEASTFWGFCSKHDAQTFAPLETRPLVPDAEQCFLLTYRPLVKELYLKKAHLATMPLARDTDKGKSKGAQLAIQSLLGGMLVGVQAAVNDLTHYKALFDADLKAQDYAHMRWVAFHLAAPPDVMCSGVLAPKYTFDGHRIQDLAELAAPMQLLSCSLVSDGTAGAAVFAWRSDSDKASGTLLDSLLALPQEQQPHAIMRYIFSEMENLFIAPAWWDALPLGTRATLEKRVAHNLGITERLPEKYLADDGVRAVGWQVTRVEQHR